MFSSVREYRTAAWRSAPFAGVSFIALLAASPAVAGGLPTSGQVVAGQVSISTAPGQMSITQAGGHAIINWQDFSIAAGNGVKFNNGGGATLNRVTGGSLSQIDGVLKAHKLDAILTPGGSGAGLAARAGYPIIVVPFGLVPNSPNPPFPAGFDAKPAPFGVGFTGAACSEPRLIELAYAFEQATKKRVPPPGLP